MNSLKRVWLVATLYGVVISALVCWLYPITVFDPITRYAPMAESFARSDFAMAYHPRFGVLFTTLAGCVSFLTGLKGDCACQVVSIFFLAFSIVPIWKIVNRVFGDARVAWVAVVMTLIATEYFMLAQDGLRDTVRIFGLACCAWTFLGGSVFSIALGLFCLVTVRTDLFLISGLILFAWWCVVVVRAWKGAWTLRVAVQLAVPTLAWLLGVFLMCLMTHAYTGIWLPGAQFVMKYQALMGVVK